MEKIKWAAIQPLTGGMYIGAQEAIGHQAEWILSYDGLDSIKVKDDKIVSAGNEYNLRQWLKKRNIDVPYYQIKERDMFCPMTTDLNPKIQRDGVDELPDYSDIDLVVAVPVCSGLSMSTTAKDDVKQSRNCNMEWIAYYTLNVIKPKVYCFENAPTLVGGRGNEIRASLEKLALDTGYSVLYYKTDTLLHDNCQRRPRTFVIFTKWQGNEPQLPPKFEYETNTKSIQECLESISKDATQQTEVKPQPKGYILIDYIKSKLGDEWYTKFDGSLFEFIIKNKLFDDFVEYTKNSDYPDDIKVKNIKYVEHVNYKLSIGMNYYGDDPLLFQTSYPSIQFKTIGNLIHYSGERFLTVREYLKLMGLPDDFELYGSRSDYVKIGQNVPVKTAKFIVDNIIRTIDNWDEFREIGRNVSYQNNMSKKDLPISS